MTGKKWSDLFGAPEDPIGRFSFKSVPGGQTAYNLSTVDDEAINLVTTRTTKAGRPNYVAPLGESGIDYYAPANAAIDVTLNEIIFSIITMQNGPVTFVMNSGNNRFNGIRVRCSGYFRLILDEIEEILRTPFTAVDLLEGVNFVRMDMNSNVYPPGAYIFYLDSSKSVGFEMQPQYKLAKDARGNDTYLTQPPGIPSIQIELMETPDPPLYMVWYNDNGDAVAVIDPKSPFTNLAPDPNNPSPDSIDPNILEEADLVTASTLHVILSNIFASADVDPTGEGTVYLPWKVEQWTVPAVSRNDYDIRKATVDVINAAKRTTKEGILNYAGQLIPAPDPKAVGLDYYSDPSVKVTLEDVQPKTSDNKKLLTIRLNKAAPVDLMYRLMPENKSGGFRDIEILASGYFQILFHPPELVDEVYRQKIVEANDISRSTTLVLIDGENMDDKNSIYPPGRYIFRPYDPAGATLTLFAKVTIKGKELVSETGAYLQIATIRQTGGDEFYNVWYNHDGPAKIINDTDPEDVRPGLKGMKQVKPILMKDVGSLVGNVQRQVTDLKRIVDGLKPTAPIWKMEQWIDKAKAIYYVVYTTDGAKIAYKADDPTKTLADLTTLTKVPTLIEEELKTDPDDTPENIAADLRNAMDMMERHAGYDNLGEQGKPFEIDWTTGKLRKMIMLTADVTVNFKNPPPIPCMFELFVIQSPSNTKDYTLLVTSSNVLFVGKTPSTSLSKSIKPSANEAREIRFFYDGKKYYSDNIDF